MSEWWQRNIVEPGKLPLLLMFAAFVVTFVTTRTLTRMIRAGVGPFKNNVSSTGVHVHHAVPGIIGLVTGAFIAVASLSGSGWHAAAAVLVGVGTSLVLDEFAVILHLEDVYWSTEGRVSVEMVSLAFACLGLSLVGAVPFGVDEVGSQELAVRTGVTIATMITLGLVMVCVRKGNAKMALFGAFVPALAWVGAIRLARPDSAWARRRYDAARRERARQRAARFDARVDPLMDRLSDLVAGRPTVPTAPSAPDTDAGVASNDGEARPSL